MATGHIDYKALTGLVLEIQEILRHDPKGRLFVFRRKRDDFWDDRQHASLFSKWLERGRFLWPSSADRMMTITQAQLDYLLEGID
ncbi:IS66 family insertion sequence element accessory protein TnpB [Ancylobacter oerskovii]|uniref:IS66 family insertion sequence element accessory protein TnpB n=1 Tax=Ancylobacter oerskovii TaxID=459519 RepID=A0ABW4Z5B8_9HYPH|nr:IS66 family insertion sequence element accessory protein TnpB [Ancylobacter oerskovii]